MSAHCWRRKASPRTFVRTLTATLACLLAGTLSMASLPSVAAGINDDSGAAVSLAQPARRIVSLAPHITELLFAVGAGGLVVGADEYSDYPPAARAIPRIGRSGALDVERIVSLHPDLVIAWGSGSSPAQVDLLRRFGIPVYVSEPRQLADIASSLRRFGQLTGSEREADRAAAAFEHDMEDLRARYGSRTSLRVFYQIWNKPLMTVNGEHIISAVLSLCGGENIFSGAAQLAPVVDLEAVLRAAPQAIIASGADARRPPWLDDWRRWPRLEAAAAGNLFSIPPDLLQRHGPRLAEGARKICAALDAARDTLAAAGPVRARADVQAGK